MKHLCVQKLLDPKNGYLSADDQTLEVAVKFFVTKVTPQKEE
jgi:hypothetical protein